jgi:hypothetical protein
MKIKPRTQKFLINCQQKFNKDKSGINVRSFSDDDSSDSSSSSSSSSSYTSDGITSMEREIMGYLYAKKISFIKPDGEAQFMQQ